MAKALKRKSTKTQVVNCDRLKLQLEQTQEKLRVQLILYGYLSDSNETLQKKNTRLEAEIKRLRGWIRGTLKVRIRKHYEPGIDYDVLLRLVFPIEMYPRAWRSSAHGGPPGCSMSFGRAIREMGGRTDYQGARRTVWIS